MSLVGKVVSNGMCTGCGLCVSSEGQMVFDGNGFLRPIAPLDDHLSKYCPGFEVNQRNIEAQYDPIWGPIIASDAGYSTDNELRLKASSGGVISAIASYLLETRLVDSVIQVGVSESDPIINKTYIVSTSDEVARNCGSRYSPSSPLSVFRNVIGDGLRYAVVGKPCDISALRGVLEDFEELKAQFPYLISFMCAGIPSIDATDDLLKKMGVSRNEVATFKYRGEGWPGLARATTKSGKSMALSYNESWGNILNRKLQPRCKLCVDGTGEAADIVCGDAWYASSDGYPLFEEENGRSLILSRTNKGYSLITRMVDQNYLSSEKFDIDAIAGIQPYQMNRKSTLFARFLGMRVLGKSIYKTHGYHLLAAARKVGIKMAVKAFVGTMKRGMLGRL